MPKNELMDKAEDVADQVSVSLVMFLLINSGFIAERRHRCRMLT